MCLLKKWHGIHTRDLKIRYTRVDSYLYLLNILDVFKTTRDLHRASDRHYLAAHSQNSSSSFSEVKIKDATFSRRFTTLSRSSIFNYSKKSSDIIFYRCTHFHKHHHLKSQINWRNHNMRLSEKFRLSFYCSKLPIVNDIIMTIYVSLISIGPECKN